MSGICARGSIGIEGNCMWGRSSIVAEKPGRPAHVVYAHFAAAILENAQLTKAVNSERRGGARDRHGEREAKDGHSNHNETEDRSHAPVFISFPRPWLTRSTSLSHPDPARRGGRAGRRRHRTCLALARCCCRQCRVLEQRLRGQQRGEGLENAREGLGVLLGILCGDVSHKPTNHLSSPVRPSIIPP